MREPRAVDKITAGEWWPPDYDGAPLVSLHDEIGRALGIGPGDKLTTNILVHDVAVTIANLREVDWSNLSINFGMIFSPGLLEQEFGRAPGRERVGRDGSKSGVNGA